MVTDPMSHPHTVDQRDSGSITDPASGRSGPCTVVSVQGHMVRLSSSIPVPLAACVNVEAGNRLWLGEVWACEPEEGAYSVEIDAAAMLKDVAAVEVLASRFRHEKTSPVDSESGIDPLQTETSPKHIA